MTAHDMPTRRVRWLMARKHQVVWHSAAAHIITAKHYRMNDIRFRLWNPVQGFSTVVIPYSHSEQVVSVFGLDSNTTKGMRESYESNLGISPDNP